MPTRPHGSTSPDGPKFPVHGHDTATREEIRRFLEGSTGRKVIVLTDQPNQGRDLLGKLLAHAESASYAVMLLTPDDEGGMKGEEPRPRARQNVVFELGLFVGLLGRERVAALHTPSIELPTDFFRVAYIDLTYSYQIELAKELNAAGIEAPVDRTLQ